MTIAATSASASRSPTPTSPPRCCRATSATTTSSSTHRPTSTSPAHYLSSTDSDRNALTVLKLLSFEERIHVYPSAGELKTEHSFALVGRRFLTLHYEIERLAATPA